MNHIVMAPAGPLDLADSIISFEEGTLPEDQVIELFQHMIDNGMAFQLQGSYGRFAMELIRSGKCRTAA